MNLLFSHVSEVIMQVLIVFYQKFQYTWSGHTDIFQISINWDKWQNIISNWNCPTPIPDSWNWPCTLDGVFHNQEQINALWIAIGEHLEVLNNLDDDYDPEFNLLYLDYQKMRNYTFICIECSVS